MLNVECVLYECVSYAKMHSNTQQSSSTLTPNKCNSAYAPISMTAIAWLFATATTSVLVNHTFCVSIKFHCITRRKPRFAQCHIHMNCTLQQQLLNQRQASPDSVR